MMEAEGKGIPAAPSGLATIQDVTGLMALTIGQIEKTIEASTASILTEIKANAKAGAQRWEEHEREHASLERRLADLVEAYKLHVAEGERIHGVERDRQIVEDYRATLYMRPIRFLRREWKWVVAIAGIAAQYVGDFWTSHAR